MRLNGEIIRRGNAAFVLALAGLEATGRPASLADGSISVGTVYVSRTDGHAVGAAQGVPSCAVLHDASIGQV